MKKIFVLLFALLILIGNKAFSKEGNTVQTTSKTPLIEDIRLQNHIDEIGFKILNANKIDHIHKYTNLHSNHIKKVYYIWDKNGKTRIFNCQEFYVVSLFSNIIKEE